MKANKILTTASDTINNRASERDQEQERSMSACVNAFNALYGTELTETMGWQFMVLLKMSRAKGGDFKLDDYIDGAAYFALAGESAGESAGAPVVIGVDLAVGADESVVAPPLPEQWKPANPVIADFLGSVLDFDSPYESTVCVNTLEGAYNNWRESSNAPFQHVLDVLRGQQYVVELNGEGEPALIRGVAWRVSMLPDIIAFERYFNERMKHVSQGSLPCTSIDNNFQQWCTLNGYIVTDDVISSLFEWLIAKDGISLSDDTREERIKGVAWK